LIAARGTEASAALRRMSWTAERTRHFLGAGNITVSFEFFPPETAAMEEMLWTSI
jgi:methylenetetrahydrofolate reductase (NADPH)